MAGQTNTYDPTTGTYTDFSGNKSSRAEAPPLATIVKPTSPRPTGGTYYNRTTRSTQQPQSKQDILKEEAAKMSQQQPVSPAPQNQPTQLMSERPRPFEDQNKSYLRRTPSSPVSSPASQTPQYYGKVGPLEIKKDGPSGDIQEASSSSSFRVSKPGQFFAGLNPVNWFDIAQSGTKTERAGGLTSLSLIAVGGALGTANAAAPSSFTRIGSGVTNLYRDIALAQATTEYVLEPTIKGVAKVQNKELRSISDEQYERANTIRLRTQAVAVGKNNNFLEGLGYSFNTALTSKESKEAGNKAAEMYLIQEGVPKDTAKTIVEKQAQVTSVTEGADILFKNAASNRMGTALRRALGPAKSTFDAGIKGFASTATAGAFEGSTIIMGQQSIRRDARPTPEKAFDVSVGLASGAISAGGLGFAQEATQYAGNKLATRAIQLFAYSTDAGEFGGDLTDATAGRIQKGILKYNPNMPGKLRVFTNTFVINSGKSNTNPLLNTNSYNEGGKGSDTLLGNPSTKTDTNINPNPDINPDPFVNTKTDITSVTNTFIDTTTTTNTQTTTNTFINTNTNTNTNTNVNPLVGRAFLPPIRKMGLNSVYGGRGSASFFGKGGKKLYSPSLTAVTANIRAKRAPTKNLSGLEVRPILERFMKKRVKRASKNPYFIVVG